MSVWDHVGIVIRSARERILTLETMCEPLPRQAKIVIVAARPVYEHHVDVYSGKNVRVVENAGTSLGSAAYMSYDVARVTLRKPWFFRMDDELPATFFNGLRERVLEVEYVIRQFYACAQKLKVTLVGPASTSRQDWMAPRMVRSYAGISGAAILCQTPVDPGVYINRRLRHFDDIYESCAHRAIADAVGRCQYIGGNKRATTGPSQTTVALLKQTQAEAVRIIEKTWPDYVHTDGLSYYTHNTERGKTRWSTPHWVFTRHPSFRGGHVKLSERRVK